MASNSPDLNLVDNSFSSIMQEKANKDELKHWQDQVWAQL